MAFARGEEVPGDEDRRDEALVAETSGAGGDEPGRGW